MGLIAIAPELVLSLAMFQYWEARLEMQGVNKADGQTKKYTMAHAMFAQMGGFVVHFCAVTPEQANAEASIIDEAGNDSFEQRMKAIIKIEQKNPIIKEAAYINLSLVGMLLYR